MSKTTRFLSLALAFVLAGCGDDGGNEPTPSIAVSLGGAVTVVQGQSGTTQVTVTRGGGFDGAVALTATALPVGVTATFDPASIPAGSGNGTSTLTLTAGENAPTGAGTFTVAANGGANLNATTNGSVTVQPKPDFSLNVTPNAVAVDQGSTGVLNVAIARAGGFTGAVNLSVTGLPNGVTAAFDNAAPTGNTAVLTLTAAADAALGPAHLIGEFDEEPRKARFETAACQLGKAVGELDQARGHAEKESSDQRRMLLEEAEEVVARNQDADGVLECRRARLRDLPG